MKKNQINHFLIGLMIFLFILPNLTYAEGRKLKVIVTHANLRDQPGMHGQVIATVTQNMILELLNDQGKWYEVKLPETSSAKLVTGYIHSSVVKLITNQPENGQISTQIPKAETNKTTLSENKGLGFGFKLTGGLAYLMGGDVNQNIEGRNDINMDWFINHGYPVNSEFNLIKYGLDFTGSILFNLTPYFGIGLGAGYIQGACTGETSYNGEGIGGDSGTWTMEPKISAIPILLTLFYNLPINSKLNVSLHAGGGLYLAKYSLQWHWIEETWWEDSLEEADSLGIGFHGGVGFEYYISPNIGFVIEASGRYVNLSGFEGTRVDTDSNGADESISGLLYYYEVNKYGNRYSIALINNTKPPESEVINPREAKIDFSGIAVRMGFIVRIGK